MTSVQVCLHGRRILQTILDICDQRWTYAGCQIAMATKFYMVAIMNCRSTVRNLLHVTRLGPRILIWLLDFWTLSARPLTTKELCFIDLPGLRDKNYDSRQCVDMPKTWSGRYKKRPWCLSRLYRFDGKRNKYEHGALIEWYWQKKPQSFGVEKTVPVHFQHKSYV